MTITENPTTEAPVQPLILPPQAQVQTEAPPAPPEDPPQTLTDTAPPPEEPSPPEQSSPAPPPILETAFVVYMNPQGHWMVAADVHEGAEMQIMRQPGIDDFFNAASTILRDIHVQETAATAAAMTMQTLDQKAESMRQAQLQQQLQQQLGGIGGPGAGAIDLSTLGSGRPGGV